MKNKKREIKMDYPDTTKNSCSSLSNISIDDNDDDDDDFIADNSKTQPISLCLVSPIPKQEIQDGCLASFTNRKQELTLSLEMSCLKDNSNRQDAYCSQMPKKVQHLNNDKDKQIPKHDHEAKSLKNYAREGGRENDTISGISQEEKQLSCFKMQTPKQKRMVHTEFDGSNVHEKTQQCKLRRLRTNSNDQLTKTSKTQQLWKKIHEKYSHVTENDLDCIANVICTGCELPLMKSNQRRIRHPYLDVIICENCFREYNTGTFTISGGNEEFCRWCGDGGELMMCDFCVKSFCNKCIFINFGKKVLNELISSSDDWRCFICSKDPIFKEIQTRSQIQLNASLMETIQSVIALRDKEKTMKGRNEKEEKVSNHRGSAATRSATPDNKEDGLKKKSLKKQKAKIMDNRENTLKPSPTQVQPSKNRTHHNNELPVKRPPQRQALPKPVINSTSAKTQLSSHTPSSTSVSLESSNRQEKRNSVQLTSKSKPLAAPSKSGSTSSSPIWRNFATKSVPAMSDYANNDTSLAKKQSSLSPLWEYPDCSRGREKYPIRCINEVDNEQLPINYSYVIDNVETPQVQSSKDPNFLVCCDCKDNCYDKSKCACIQLMQDGHAYTATGHLLQPLDIIYECNDRCSCHSMLCINRVVRNGISLPLEIFRTPGKGWGVRCTVDITAGTFVCCYLGEILTEEEAEKRGLLWGDEYLFDLDTWARDVATQKLKQMGLKEGFERFAEDHGISVAAPLHHSRHISVGKDCDVVDATNVVYIDTDNPMSLPNRENVTPSSLPSCTSEELSALELQLTSPHFDSNTGALTPRSYHKVRAFFDAVAGKQDQRCIDAKWYGNIGRFINHSCDPNCCKQTVFVDSHDVLMPRMALFALWDIPAFQEITYDYGYSAGTVVGKTMKCRCGASSCRGNLY